MNFVDLGVFIIIGLCAISGYKNGLLYTIYRFVSFFAALLVSWLLFPVLSRLLRATRLHDIFSNMVSNAFDLENRATSGVFDNMGAFIEDLPLPDMFKNILSVNIDLEAPVQTADNLVSSLIANMIINGLSIILIFLLVTFGFSFLGGLVNLVGRLPIIKKLNRLGGVIVGILVGAVLSWLALALFIMIIVFAANQYMADLIQDSFIVRVLMGGDVVVDIIAP